MKMIITLLLALSLVGCKDREQAVSTSSSGIDRLSISTPTGRQDFIIELALTSAQIRKGLMYREHMPVNAGMLFYFGDEAERGFYMKNTLIPLDMIFIRKDGRIHSIHENARPHDETTIYSKGPAAAVLEINGGLSKKLGIRPGQTVHHPFFGNSLAPQDIID